MQDVGRVITKQDRCIAFPNIYQHLVSPFKLADPTRPGHRKIAVLFLVDPTIRVPSATDVGMQQADWVRRELGETTLWLRLPVELRDKVWEYAPVMTREEAEKYRGELMKERTKFVGVVDGQRFGCEFNMW